MKKLLIISVLLASMLLAACGGKNTSSADGGEVFEFGTQSYSDPKIMAQITKQLIEDRTDHEVNITEDIQASPQIVTAMDKGDFDLALLFSGEVYNNYFDEDEVEYTTDPEKTMDQAQKLFKEKYDFKWYDDAGFSDQYSIAIHNDFAEENNIETMSDLSEYAGDLVIGADSTWIQRDNDGLRAYQEAYGAKFKDTKGMQVSLMYEGMKNNELDVIAAYTVDPHIPEYDLKLLEDDQNFFPPYEGSIVARNEVVNEYPEVAEVLDSIVGLITTEEMTALIREVDINGRDTAEVAKEFLQAKGLLD